LDRALSGLLLAGFVLLPGAFLYAFFQGFKVCCHHLADTKFFEPLSESATGYLLVLLLGLSAINFLEFIRYSVHFP
jgi:hypothetical protein